MSVTSATLTDVAEEVVDRIAVRVSALDGSRPGGALLGPRLMVAAAVEANCVDRLVQVGTAVELLRRAILIHRTPQVEEFGSPECGVRLSGTLRGDMLFAESFRLLSDDGEPRLGTVLSSAIAAVTIGEMGYGEVRDSTERVTYAAAYYRGAAATGAVLRDADEDCARELAVWGQAIGEAHERALIGAPWRAESCPEAVPLELREWVLRAIDTPDRAL